jgi:hypothetical protein
MSKSASVEKVIKNSKANLTSVSRASSKWNLQFKEVFNNIKKINQSKQPKDWSDVVKTCESLNSKLSGKTDSKKDGGFSNGILEAFSLILEASHQPSTSKLNAEFKKSLALLKKNVIDAVPIVSRKDAKLSQPSLLIAASSTNLQKSSKNLEQSIIDTFQEHIGLYHNHPEAFKAILNCFEQQPGQHQPKTYRDGAKDLSNMTFQEPEINALKEDLLKILNDQQYFTPHMHQIATHQQAAQTTVLSSTTEAVSGGAKGA